MILTTLEDGRIEKVKSESHQRYLNLMTQLFPTNEQGWNWCGDRRVRDDIYSDFQETLEL